MKNLDFIGCLAVANIIRQGLEDHGEHMENFLAGDMDCRREQILNVADCFDRTARLIQAEYYRCGGR